jgi:hypothetical protein
VTPGVQSIAELPFVRRPLFDLLGFDQEREVLDVDYAGFGWAIPPRLWLQGEDGQEEVTAPLLLALHSADDGRPLAEDIELDFQLDDLEPGRTVITTLSRFLDSWLPRLPATEAVVLALCNPHHARLTAPRAAGDRRVHYAIGSVDSWLDECDELLGEDERQAQGRFRLTAAQWRVAPRRGEASVEAMERP